MLRRPTLYITRLRRIQAPGSRASGYRTGRSTLPLEGTGGGDSNVLDGPAGASIDSHRLGQKQAAHIEAARTYTSRARAEVVINLRPSSKNDLSSTPDGQARSGSSRPPRRPPIFDVNYPAGKVCRPASFPSVTGTKPPSRRRRINVGAQGGGRPRRRREMLEPRPGNGQPSIVDARKGTPATPSSSEECRWPPPGAAGRHRPGTPGGIRPVAGGTAAPGVPFTPCPSASPPASSPSWCRGHNLAIVEEQGDMTDATLGSPAAGRSHARGGGEEWPALVALGHMLGALAGLPRPSHPRRRAPTGKVGQRGTSSSTPNPVGRRRRPRPHRTTTVAEEATTPSARARDPASPTGVSPKTMLRPCPRRAEHPDHGVTPRRSKPRLRRKADGSIAAPVASNMDGWFRRRPQPGQPAGRVSRHVGNPKRHRSGGL